MKPQELNITPKGDNDTSRQKNPWKKTLTKIVWMAPALGVALAAVLLALFSIVDLSHGQSVSTTTVQTTSNTVSQFVMGLSQTMLGAIPPPADAPLLDASGNVVLDASGNPVSDPDEKFHVVIPHDFDPGHTNLVEAGWLDGLGCPTNAMIAISNSTGTGIDHFEGLTDLACPTGDAKDKKNEGLLLVKTGPSNNFAAAVAELKKVRGITLTELGYDIRKAGGNFSALGSHCGGGAPRFDVVTTDGVDHFVGDCNVAPPLGPDVVNLSGDWVRLRWGPTQFALAGPPITAGEVVQRIVILFDEGTDTGLDFFGAAIIDNIDVNGTLVGHGPDED